MPTDIDPEGREVEGLFAAADFRDARVLEIGCGPGRLTRRYAGTSRHVVGIDHDADGIAAARRDRPIDSGARLTYLRAGGAALPFRQHAFDIVLFGWSL